MGLITSKSSWNTSFQRMILVKKINIARFEKMRFINIIEWE